MAPSTSILRKKEKAQQKSTKRDVNVSFATGASKKSAGRTEPPNDTRFTNDDHTGGDNRDGEEAACFDPVARVKGAVAEEDRLEIERQIRRAKSTRATSRAAALGSSNIFDDADDCGTAMYGDRGERLSGEMEVDRHLSLVHDYHGGKDGKDGSDGISDKVQCPVEPFNLTSEREDGGGYFDGDTYVFRKHQNEGEEDAWLDNLKSEDGEGVAGPKASSENKYVPPDGYIVKPRKKNESKDNSNALDQTTTKEQVYERYIPLLATDTETVMQALSRYGAILKMETKQKKNRDKMRTSDERASASKQGRTSASHAALDRLTELANFCMMNFADGGNIYERDRAYFMKCLGKSDTEREKRKQPSYFATEDGSTSGGGAHRAPTPKRAKASADIGCENDADIKPGKVAQWEYRGNQDNAIHGPYSTRQMVDWISAGYFLGDMAVDVRPVGDATKIVADTDATVDLAQATKQDVVDDLLGDLDDDEEEGGDVVETAKEWMRSDLVNFSSYLQ